METNEKALDQWKSIEYCDYWKSAKPMGSLKYISSVKVNGIIENDYSNCVQWDCYRLIKPGLDGFHH